MGSPKTSSTALIAEPPSALCTRLRATHGVAARLDQRLGWAHMGDIPDCALYPDGRLCSTTSCQPTAVADVRVRSDDEDKGGQRDSNPRQPGPQPGALPTELWPPTRPGVFHVPGANNNGTAAFRPRQSPLGFRAVGSRHETGELMLRIPTRPRVRIGML